ncbi:MarR family transcriptional regulator, partial [Streptomyces sp. McG3]|nr:MarR family transcriptional regulator [Streptomyces sp. McG3]
VGTSPAYLALARLGRDDHRLALSADDCAALEGQAAEWLARGVSVDFLTSALTAGLPAQVNSPLGLLRRRLTDKMPPRLAPENAQPAAPAPTRHLLVECTDCGRPGPPQALPDGLCRPCRDTHSSGGEVSIPAAEVADVKARMSNLRDLLRPV